MRPLIRCLVLGVLCSSFLRGGTTGKIAGRVVDAKNGEGLIGVNIVLAGTTLGASTDVDGNYFINNVPPAVYTLRASAVGYSGATYENVKVNIDLTTRIDISLSETVVELGKEVVVTAERPLVQKDLTATTAVVGGDDIKQLPVTEVTQVINLQAGNVAGHLRGGRGGEVAYWIDGIPVTDSYDGSTVVDVNTNMVQELQVLSGAFNAEYGQAMSGIVNIATREGAEKFSGSITTYAGDFLSAHNDIFKGIGQFDISNIRNFEGSLSGPLGGNDLSYFVNARSIYFGGFLEGDRRFTPHTVATLVNDQMYIVGTNPSTDTVLVFLGMPAAQKASEDSLKKYFPGYYAAMRSSNAGGIGDNKRIPMNWNQKLYLQGKVSYRLSPEVKIGLNGIMDNVDSYPYDRFFQYNPDGKGLDHRRSYTGILQLTHTLSASTFYTVGASVFSKSFRHYLYENEHDPRYTHPDLTKTLNSVSYLTGGSDLNRFYRMTTTYLVKVDVSSQVTNEHFVKVGFEGRQNRIFLEDINLRPIDAQAGFTPGFSSPYITTQVLGDSSNQHDRYVHYPVELSAYVQDKMEFKDLIINLGIRLDYFEPDGNVLADEEDPNIYSPFKPGNQFFDLNGNGIQDLGEKTKTVADRRKYWFQKASPKVQFSPRFGASFPITDRGVIHFSYGHFFQIPNFYQLYANPGFKVGKGTGNVDINGNPTGNADLKPEQTINGEIGLQQQLTDDLSLDLTGYLRDIRNLSGTRADQITIGGANGSSTYTKYVNSDFGFVRGIIISLDKRFSQGLALSLDYTYQIARGSASSSKEARDQLANGILPEVQLTPLGWDQRHTLNATLAYSQNGYGGSIVGQYGSGTPYTPDVSKDISAFLNNSQTKPVYFNADMRLYATFPLDPVRLLVFLRLNNIFDIKNEVEVYGDTGRAGKTYREQQLLESGARSYVNSIHDYYLNPTQYSEPRRLELGATVEF